LYLFIVDPAANSPVTCIQDDYNHDVGIFIIER